jgi:hypothetical protein
MGRNKIIILTVIFVCISAASRGQDKCSASFWGINPSITVEPFYNKGELDINIFPLVFQKTITRRVDFRISTIVNYGIRNENSAFSHLGAQVSFPVFIIRKDENTLPSNGFFVAPGFGVTRNLIEEHNNFGLWLEPGYNLLISPKYSISFGAQFGATHFWYDNGTKKWGNHFGVKIIIGRWY